MDVEKAVSNILEDLENQPLQKSRTFQAYLNAPELISVSSTNAIQQSPPINANLYNAYYNFTVNLPRPAINAKSIQLLKAIIPQAQCSIPDYSLVFPYYRLKCVPINDIGEVLFLNEPNFSDNPAVNTLFFVRLLPSNWKPEYLQLNTDPITNANNYGYNRTFNYYDELLTEINKACLADIARPDSDIATNFVAGDVSFFYSEKFNKFVFRGNNYDTPHTFPAWIESTTYVKNDIVVYDGITYLALGTSTGEVPPDNPASWRNISQYFNAYPLFNIYFVAGYNDREVERLLQRIENVSNEDYFNGLQHITSVVGNKYVEGQTLARRMGFTWDGTGMIYDKDIMNDAIGTQITYGGTVAFFFNRMRPVPLYFVRDAEEELAAPLQNIVINYTADGYCNMVYSSIINIYTTIIGTSSVDTQRNANLLATVEMNCPNLGIMMANNFIDTKLTKLQPDIYSIYFELRDENGEPYYLTNNATTTLLLKLTYPE